MKSIYNSQSFSQFSKFIGTVLSNKILFIKICILIILFLFAIASIIPTMIKVWSRYDYSHGFVIPLISLYFVWLKREKLKEIPILPNYVGGMIILSFGSLMLILSKTGSVAIVQLLSIIVIITGLILLLLGTRFLKALSMPVAYLILSVPVLDLIQDKISFPLQLFLAKVTSPILNLCNVPVFQNAQYLELPTATLEIAPECSGISFLISFIAIGIPLAYFTQKSLLRRASLIAFAIFCCISANILRITLIGLWTYYSGKNVHGPLHVFIGAFISVVGFIFLFIGAWFFAEVRPGQQRKHQIKEVALSDMNIDLNKFNWALLLSFILLFSTGSYLYRYNPQPVSLIHSLSDLNATVGTWTGQNTSLDIEDLKIGGADSEITRVYTAPSGRQVKLYIGYFASQKQGKEMIFYTLQKLYSNTREIVITLDSHNSVRVNKALMPYGPDKSVPVLYWHDVQGKIIANRYAVKFLTALNGLIRGRTNGALIMVYSDNESLNTIEQVLNDEIDFAKELMPVLDRYLPGH